MAAHGHHQDLSDDRIQLGGGSKMIIVIALIVAAVGLALALTTGNEAPIRLYQRFFYSYLMAFAFCLSIALGCMINVVLHHTTRAGWNVTVRRTTENIAGTLPVFVLLSLPLLYSVIQNKGVLYPWAMPSPAHVEEPGQASEEHPNPETAKPNEVPATADKYAQQRDEQIKTGQIDPEIAWKRVVWYSNPFFFARIALYLGVWCFLAIRYRRQSIRQDENGDPEITTGLQALGPVGLILLALSITFFAFDMLMSLDPRWYSTMWGVYYIAGCLVSGFAAVIIAVFLLQQFGYLRTSVSIEHYHDLGKYLFGFTFFYGYIAFSQYMLLWYASIPEEVTWYSRHGATTLHPSAWSYVILAILFGKFAIPFLGTISRHVKRNKFSLAFWACWIIVFQLVDVYWMVMPQYGPLHPTLCDLGAVLLVGGVFVAAIVFNMSSANLRPTHDPRLPDALAFTNI
jgi:hypothetical protein